MQTHVFMLVIHTHTHTTHTTHTRTHMLYMHLLTYILTDSCAASTTATSRASGELGIRKHACVSVVFWLVLVFTFVLVLVFVFVFVFVFV
jgi:hypothetical protein